MPSPTPLPSRRPIHSSRLSRSQRTFGVLLGLLLVGLPPLTQAARVIVAPVQERQLLREVPLTGSVSSPQIALLSAEVAGLVKSLNVDAGDQVEQGDLLLELDDELSQIAVDRAQANAAQARAALAESQRRLEEARSLESRNSIAASDVRTLEARQRIDSAALQESEAQVQQRRAELERHRIRAPFSGTISRKLTEAGEWVAPGSQLLELLATDNLRIDFRVPQSFFPQINLDTRLTLRVDAYPERRFRGAVSRKVPQADNNARTFLLRVVVDDEIETSDGASQPLLIPGMSINAIMTLGNNAAVPSVPRDALVRYPDGRVSVWQAITDAAGETSATERFITTGLDSAQWVEVLSGVSVGAMVVVEGNEALREGQPIEIVTNRRGH